MSDLVTTTLETLALPGMMPGDAARELSAGLLAEAREMFVEMKKRGDL